jgi:hypothetical protein
VEGKTPTLAIATVYARRFLGRFDPQGLLWW